MAVCQLLILRTSETRKLRENNELLSSGTLLDNKTSNYNCPFGNRQGNMLRQAIFIFCIDQYRAKRMEKLEGPSASRPRSKVQKELPRFLTENCSVEGCYKLKSINSHSISESDWSLLCLLALAPTKNSCYLIRKQPSLELVLGTFKMPDVALPVAQYCLADHRQDSLMDILKPPRMSSIRRLGLYGFLLYRPSSKSH